MPPLGFEPTVLAGERPQNHVLDRTVTAIGTLMATHLLDLAWPSSKHALLLLPN